MSQKDQALVYMEQARRYNNLKPHLASPAIPGLLVDVTTHHESLEEKAFAEDATSHSGACAWPPRSSYSCSFCRREFRSAQALGGHMNVHRRDRARLKQYSSSLGQRGEQQDPPTVGAKHGQSRPFGPLVPGDQAANPNPNPNSSVAEAPITRFSQPEHLTRGNVILISTNCFSSCITGDKFGLKNVPEEEQDLGSKEIRNGLRRWTDQGSRIKAITDCCSKRRRTEPTTTNLILNFGACSGGQKQGRAKDLLIDCNAVEELDLELRL